MATPAMLMTTSAIWKTDSTTNPTGAGSPAPLEHTMWFNNLQIYRLPQAWELKGLGGEAVE